MEMPKKEKYHSLAKVFLERFEKDRSSQDTFCFDLYDVFCLCKSLSLGNEYALEDCEDLPFSGVVLSTIAKNYFNLRNATEKEINSFIMNALWTDLESERARRFHIDVAKWMFDTDPDIGDDCCKFLDLLNK